MFNATMSADTVINFLFDCAESDIRLLRRAYNMVRDPQWQQVQMLKAVTAGGYMKGWLNQGVSYFETAKAEVLVKKQQGLAIAHHGRCLARGVRQAMVPGWVKLLEGAAILLDAGEIALSWMAVGEEFVKDCWQAYVAWVDEFVESRTEPEFDFAPVEIRLLTTPVLASAAFENIPAPQTQPTVTNFGDFVNPKQGMLVYIKERLFGLPNTLGR